MYNWTNVTIPKLTDFFNNSSRNAAQIVTVAWVDFLGGWFFAAVLGVIASALYIKTKNVMGPIALLVIGNLLLGRILPDSFLYLVGLIVAFAIGFILYQLFVSKEE